MKHAGKNNLKNVTSLTLGDEKPKIDTGQKVNSNHHIGARPAQVRQMFSYKLSSHNWTLDRTASKSKVKVKFALDQVGELRHSSALSLTSVLDWVGS